MPIVNCLDGVQRDFTPAEIVAMQPGLAQAQAEKWEMVKRRRDAAIASGVSVPGIGIFDSDPVSILNISGAVTGAIMATLASEAFAISWKLANNSVVMLDAAQMQTVGSVALGYVAAAHANAQALGLTIQAATTTAQVSAIDIEEGWP